MKQDPESIRRTGLTVFVRLFAALCLVCSLQAATLRVTNDFPTILAAYSNAVSNDTIKIQSGLYLEGPPVLFGNSKALLLCATNGRVILAPLTPPANDGPLAAAPLSGVFASAFAYNYTATGEMDEPSHQGYTNFSRSMWWAWTAPTNGQAIFAVDLYEFPPLLDVFGQSNGLPVTLPANRFLWQSNTEASLIVNVGDPYLIRVVADGAGYGGARVNVVMPAPPPNDARTNAIPLSGDHARVAGNTYAATEDGGEPQHAGVGVGRSVWYAWTAPTNTGQPSHPLLATTAGSDFDTVLAVYTTNEFGALQVVATNDNVGIRERYSRVTFVPLTGETYFFAIDGSDAGAGSSLRRTIVGNYSLRLDYSWLNLTTRLIDLDNPYGDGSLRMTVEFTVNHYGFVPVGPLRVRVVGRATNSVSGIHLLGAAGESNLLIFPITLTSSGPGGYGFVTTNFIRPAPLTLVDPEHPPFWGAFAILEEQNGPNWFHIDNDFVGFGEIPPGGDGGLNFGVGRVFQRLAASDPVVEDVKLVKPPFATDESTAEVVVVATFSVRSDGHLVDQERSVKPVRWIVPTNFPIVTVTNITLTTTGILGIITIGQLPSTTDIEIDADVNIGGLPYDPDPIALTIYKRPALMAQPATPPGTFLLTLLTEPGKRYRVEWTDAFLGTNTAWLPLMTNFITASASTYVTNLPASGPATRFFRAFLQP